MNNEGLPSETRQPGHGDVLRCIIRPGLGSILGGPSTGGVWTKVEKESNHINVLELLAAELAIKTFLKGKNPKLVHLFMDNMTAIYYLIHKGGTKISQKMTGIAKRIWEFLLEKETTITASWIPSKVNKIADWRSRQKANSSEWELSGEVFQKLVRLWGETSNRLFCLKDNEETKMSLNPDPDCQATNGLYQNWGDYPYLFPLSV